jgi:hypothetical protein
MEKTLQILKSDGVDSDSLKNSGDLFAPISSNE